MYPLHEAIYFVLREVKPTPKFSLTLNTNFYIHEGTIEKFYKSIHKISFLFMILLYFSISFYTNAYSKGIECEKNNKKIYTVSFSFPLGLIFVVIILRKFFLFSKKFDKLSTISISFLIIGFLPLFYFENKKFDDYDNNLKPNKHPLIIL